MQEYNEFNQPLGVIVPNFIPANRPNNDFLTGDLVQLQPLQTHHLPDLYQAMCVNSPLSNWTYLTYGPFADYQEFANHYQQYITHNDPFFYAVVNKKNQKPEGVASYLRIDPANAVIEIGHIYWSALMQRTPKSAQAVHLMIENAKKLGNRRIEWKCNSLNEPSNKAALRYGFQFEGAFRQHIVAKGRNRDSNWYSIIT